MGGIIVINKSCGCTSRDVVNEVSRIFKTKKVGHTGTLDPGASGVLVICIGKALKIAELLTNHDKEYIAGVTLGIETDTIDMDGTILREENVNIDKEQILSVIDSFKGRYIQEVPKYSAVKVNGRKLYEYARSNITVELPKKEVEIKEISLLDDITYENEKVYFKIKCTVSKGTYIRSLVRDIGNRLGTIAVMNSLVRTRLGNFKIQDSYTIDDIEKNNYKLLSIIEVFPDIPRLVVNDDIAFKIKNGVMIKDLFKEDRCFILDKDNNLLALYLNINGKCRPYKMFV